jgi:hypothetical protein
VPRPLPPGAGGPLRLARGVRTGSGMKRGSCGLGGASYAARRPQPPETCSGGRRVDVGLADERQGRVQPALAAPEKNDGPRPPDGDAGAAVEVISSGPRPSGFGAVVPARLAAERLSPRPAGSPLEAPVRERRPETNRADGFRCRCSRASRVGLALSTAQPDAYRPQLPEGVGSSRPPEVPVVAVPLTSGAGGTSSPPTGAGVISAGAEAMLVVERAGMNVCCPAP